MCASEKIWHVLVTCTGTLMEESQVNTGLLANRLPFSESGCAWTDLSSHPRCLFCNP